MNILERTKEFFRSKEPKDIDLNNITAEDLDLGFSKKIDVHLDTSSSLRSENVPAHDDNKECMNDESLDDQIKEVTQEINVMYAKVVQLRALKKELSAKKKSGKKKLKKTVTIDDLTKEEILLILDRAKVEDYTVYVAFYVSLTHGKRISEVLSMNYMYTVGYIERDDPDEEYVGRDVKTRKKFKFIMTQKERQVVREYLKMRNYSEKKYVNVCYKDAIYLHEDIRDKTENKLKKELKENNISMDQVSFNEEAQKQFNEYCKKRVTFEDLPLLIDQNDKILSYWNYRRRLKRIAKKCGINKNVGSHTPRRAFAGLLLDDGVDESLVSEAMNHSSVRQTRRYANRNKKIMKIVRLDIED